MTDKMLSEAEKPELDPCKFCGNVDPAKFEFCQDEDGERGWMICWGCQSCGPAVENPWLEDGFEGVDDPRIDVEWERLARVAMNRTAIPKPRQDAGRPTFWSEDLLKVVKDAPCATDIEAALIQIRELQAALTLEAKPQTSAHALAWDLEAARSALGELLAAFTLGGDKDTKADAVRHAQAILRNEVKEAKPQTDNGGLVDERETP